jgi:hypothetical protein
MMDKAAWSEDHEMLSVGAKHGLFQSEQRVFEIAIVESGSSKEGGILADSMRELLFDLHPVRRKISYARNQLISDLRR